MEKVTLQTGSLRNTQLLNKGKESQEAGQPSGPLVKPWSEQEIHCFLQEWELIEREVALGVKENHAVARVIAQRLNQRGIKKSWKKCYHMLVSLQDLYWTICEANESPRSEPLPCPYGAALQRILGYGWKDNDLSDPVCDHAAGFPQPICQPQDCGIPIPLGEPSWAPPPVIFVADLQVPGWEPWNVNPPWTIPYLLPAILPGPPSRQQQWSASYD